MSEKAFVYISCWDNLGGAPGIAIFGFDRMSGEMEPVKVVREDLSCGFSFMDRQRGILHVCVETEDHPDYYKGGGGRIVSFHADPQTGALSVLGEAATFCPNPCYLSVDATGKYALVANHSAYNASTKIGWDEAGKPRAELVYDDAVVELFRINEDGTIGELLDFVKHDFPAKGRPLHSHPQSIVMAPSGKFFICTDTGDHHIYTYGIDYAAEKLLRCFAPYAHEAKSKPRYTVFHPALPYFYVNHEGVKDVAVFKYGEDGAFQPVCSVSAVPAGEEYPAGKGQSGLLMHPSGKYLYDILTATAAVAVFRIDEQTGIPERIQYETTREPKLRSFGLSPDGRFLITTCIQTGGIQVFSVGEDGLLSPTGHGGTQKGAAFVTFGLNS